MSFVLPIGCEYEQQFSVSKQLGAFGFCAQVFKYRVIGHSSCREYSHAYIAAEIEPLSSRQRAIVNMRFDEPDMYGQPVQRCDFEGDPPSPTYAEQLAKYGIEVTEPTPKFEVLANRERVRQDRAILQSEQAA